MVDTVVAWMVLYDFKYLTFMEVFMVDRSYLRFKSARDYVDKGMAKWIGFFISEHTSALAHMGNVIDVSQSMSNDEIILAISQVYVNGLYVMVYTRLRQSPYHGKIKDIFGDSIYLCADESLNIFLMILLKLL